PWARWFDAVGGELGGAPLKQRVIHRRPVDWVLGIDERLGAADSELGEDPGRKLLFAERDQQMLGARPQNATGRGRSARPTHYLPAGGPPPEPELELAAETVDRRDHIVDRTGVDARTGEQTRNIPAASGREQQMLGVNPGVTQHPRLVIGQQDRVVGLVVKPAQRVLRPSDRDAGIVARAAAGTARARKRPPGLGVLLTGLRHARADRAL